MADHYSAEASGNRRYTPELKDWADRAEPAALKAALARHVRALADARVLEISCGHGRNRPLLTELGYEYHWCDGTPRAVAGASQLSETGGLQNGRFDTAAALPYADRSFELLACTRFFNRIDNRPDRVRMLSEIARVTSNWAVISFYDKYCLHHLTHKLATRTQGSQGSTAFLASSEIVEDAEFVGLHCVAMTSLVRGVHAQRFAILRRGAPVVISRLV